MPRKCRLRKGSRTRDAQKELAEAPYAQAESPAKQVRQHHRLAHVSASRGGEQPELESHLPDALAHVAAR